MPEEIENPWCVYGWFLGLWNFGKIEEDRKHSVNIRYSEGQLYSPECWNSKWVKRFPSLIEAVEHYIAKCPEVDIRTRGETDCEIRERARRNFPKYYKSILPMVISN